MGWSGWVQDFLQSIPATFWGVVFGALFSLSGVTLTNRANDRRLRAQFEHDREIRTKERDLMLRKEIYLAGAEAFHAGSLMISQMPNLDLSQEELQGAYRKKAPAISKIQIIAGEKAMEAVAGAMSTMGEEALKLLGKRTLLMTLKQQIASADELVVGFSKVRDQMLELMTQHNIDGNSDQRRFETLQKNLEFEQNRIQELLNKRNDMFLDLAEKQFSLSEECLLSTHRLAAEMVPVLIAVREELNLPFASESYLKLLRDLQQRQLENMSQFLMQIRSLIATNFQNATSISGSADRADRSGGAPC